MSLQILPKNIFEKFVKEIYLKVCLKMVVKLFRVIY